MSRFSTEQWERKKWYLIRSLFEEEPRLSPIPERLELSLGPPSLDSEINYQGISRPLSPLPDLVIEKEPNHHDESEDFYQELEREVMKLYRKLFLDKENYSQYSERSESTDEANDSITQFIGPHFCDSETIENLNTSPTEKSYDFNEEQSQLNDTSVEDTTSESYNDEIVVTQALVHHSNGENKDRDSEKVSICRMQNILSEVRSYIEDCEEQSKDEHMQTDFRDSSVLNSEQNKLLCLPKDEESNPLTCYATDASLSPEEPEIMRRRETSDNSIHSLSAVDGGKYFSANFSTDKISKNTSVREMEEAEISSPESSVILGMTSTPKTIRKVRNGGTKRRISEMYCRQNRSSLKKRKFENAVTQTSFNSSDDEDNWIEIQKHFFMGNPRIFKLCSCKNHDCCL